MKRSILVVAPYLPLPADFGGALRIYHLVRELSHDHAVSLLAPGSQDEYPAALALGQICDVTMVPAQTTGRQPAGRRKRAAQLQSVLTGRSFLQTGAFHGQMQTALDRILQTRRIDLVQYEFPESALYQVPESVPVVFDAHNIEHELLARIARTSQSSVKQVFNLMESRKVRRVEFAAWRRATVCVATSERDAYAIQQAVSTPVDVVPNGVDLGFFARAPFEAAEPGHVVFTGAMRHQPNADGARWYVEHVHPLVQREIPDARVTIAGANPPASVLALASDSVQVTGYVDDVRPYIAWAGVMVVPLWSGGGTRLKILEAFAAGRPVVSTSLGAEGIEAQPGRHLLIADTPEAFASEVVRLHRHPELGSSLANNARALAESRYGWPAIAERLVASHDRAIELARG